MFTGASEVLTGKKTPGTLEGHRRAQSCAWAQEKTEEGSKLSFLADLWDNASRTWRQRQSCQPACWMRTACLNLRTETSVNTGHSTVTGVAGNLYPLISWPASWPSGSPGGAVGKESARQRRRRKRHSFGPWVGKLPWRKKWQCTPVFLPGKSHGQRSLVGYSPLGCKE